jgi:hypothetical protein
MNDNLRRFRAIKDYFWQTFPVKPTGRQAQHLLVLISLINGLVGSRNAHLPAIAAKNSDGTKRDSRVKRYERYLENERIVPAVEFAWFAHQLLESLAHRPLVVVIDASALGQGCTALVVSVVYKGRALPLGWLVLPVPKGQLSQAQHIRLLKQIHPLVPKTAQVIFLGDGEFDGLRLLRRLAYYGWHYVCRTAKSSQLWFEDETARFESLAVQPGELVQVEDTAFSKKAYAPILAVAVWQKGCQQPIYLVTNLELAEEALFYYKKRFRIETLFSDYKSRGFRLDKSHMRDPARLGRLLLAAALAYLWLIYLGTVALAEGWNKIIHRTNRLDLSLFNLGLNLLEHFLNQLMPLPVAFLPLADEPV